MALLCPAEPPPLPAHLPAGEATTACAKALAPGGTLVVFGAMSREPLALPPGLLIFNDLRLRGFWLTGGYAKVRRAGRRRRARQVRKAPEPRSSQAHALARLPHGKRAAGDAACWVPW